MSCMHNTCTHMGTVNLQIYGLLHINDHAITNHGMYKYMLVIAVFMVGSFPGPSPPRRGLVHSVCSCAKYFPQKLCALPCPYAEDYTNYEYRAFFELDSSNDLTCRTLLGYYFSEVAVSFFQTYSSTER